tara:strand:- start:457 stop:1101 length:645 start_codon:yes stop_codon:yes gene_type:complete
MAETFTREQMEDAIRERIERLKSKHSEQIAAVRSELALAGTEIGKLREKVTTLEPYELQVSELNGKIERAERVNFLSELGIPAEALADIEAIYQSRTVGEEEAPSFRDFYSEEGAGRSVPLLAGYFSGSAGAPSENGGIAVSSPVSGTLPNVHRGAPASVPRSGAMNLENAQALMSGPGWAKMSREEQDQTLRAVERQLGTSYGTRWKGLRLTD